MDFLNQNHREKARHYIPASQEDISAMLKTIGLSSLKELFQHLPASALFPNGPDLPEELDYSQAADRLKALSEKNHIMPSFIGDALPDFSVHEIVPFVSSIRNLTTAYTPYQPERSQGTLITHWIYQCIMYQLTGFEAINSSLYDRSTALFEAFCTAVRIGGKDANTLLVTAGVFPQDLEVLRTLSADTELEVLEVPLDAKTGKTDLAALKKEIAALGSKLAAIAFPQVNHFGLLEDVDALTDLAVEAGVPSIAVIDPLLLATGGLKAPVHFGQKGATIIVGEGQHLAIGPNFGGPGLGVFGVRLNDEVKNHVRATPGRFVGKALDEKGRDCRVMVMSTREQHIRKDKATSNICSNQAFLATLAGASVLARGESGMNRLVETARQNALRFLQQVNVKLAFPGQPFFNEIVLEVDDAAAILQRGRQKGILAGLDVSNRLPGKGRSLLKISFSDQQSAENIAALASLFSPGNTPVPEIPAQLLRSQAVELPEFDLAELKNYYQRLGELNVSPDNGCYPLGSCTMKYNPYLNDWAANLDGFTKVHPQAPVEDVQGCLELLYEIQEWFKGITGLAGVTTQPLAGAQGELVGLKLFQAYHRHRGDTKRDVILIPRSAHGTNFATAAMAGFVSRTVDGRKAGIVLLNDDPNTGRIDLADFEKKLAEAGDHLCGVMITNPNTCGLFETDFKLIADKVHAAGGLVYMDGANMNAIAGWVNLAKLGVDAVHNNLHKTWTIPHGGGGPGDAIVAVSEKLVDFLPGFQVVKEGNAYRPVKAPNSIGSFHRHWGNFAHKIRCYAYLLRLGKEGVPRMSAMAVLSSRYLFEKLKTRYPSLPAGAADQPRMHEFILTLTPEDFDRLAKVGVPKALAITRVGKLFLDFGFHAPTVAWPETFGLMIEPTESYTKAELDRFAEAVLKIKDIIEQSPEALNSTPHFTPVDRVDEVAANRAPVLCEKLEKLPALNNNRLSPDELNRMPLDAIKERIEQAMRKVG